jgi:flagellin
MGLRIHTNVPGLVAQKNLRANRDQLDRNLEHLSTGYRINHAADDAAGLATSEILKAEARGLQQTERNAQDGISVIQIAEGALGEISQILIRLREIGVQASSDTLGSQERSFLNTEFQQLLSEVDRIAQSTSYNHIPLLNGAGNSFEIQVGTQNTPIVDRISLFNPSTTNVTNVALGLNLTCVKEKSNAQQSLVEIDSAFSHLTQVRTQLGAMQNRLQSILSNILTHKENLTSTVSRIKDADMAEESSELTKNNILLQAGVSVLTQANNSIKVALNLLNQGSSS